MKTMTVLTLFCWATLGVAATATGTVPDSVKKYADGMQGDLAKMVAGDSSMMKDLGMKSADDVARLKLDYSKAFVMQKVEANKVEGAQSLSQAVASTGIYYVPMCDGGHCAMMAAFRVDPTTHEASFESVGQPNLTQNIADARARVAGDTSLDGDSLRVVEYNEAGVGLLLAKKSGSDEEVLIPQSDAEARAMLTQLNRPAAERDASGRPRFGLGDLRMIAKVTHDRAQLESTEPTSASGEPGDARFDDRPFNALGAPAEARYAQVDAATTAVATSGLAAAGATTSRDVVSSAAVSESTAGAPAQSRLAQFGAAVLGLLAAGYFTLRSRAKR